MAIELDDMLCEADGTATPEHELRWQDQSGQGQAPIVIHTSYTKFPGAAFNVTGTVSIGSAVVASVSPISRLVIGMSVTGTGIPAGTTVASVDSVNQFTMSAVGNGSATGAPITINVNGVGTITVTDPVINFGYNTKGGGVAIDPAKTQAYFQIEGHYDRGGTDAWAEAFVSFTAPGQSRIRPFFIGFDAVANETAQVSIGASPGNSTTIQRHTFQENSITLIKSAATTGVETFCRMESHTGQGSNVVMTNDGNDPNTFPQFNMRLRQGAGDLNSSLLEVSMYNNDATPTKKAGLFHLYAGTGATDNTVRGSIGRNGWGGVDDYVWGIYCENAAASRHGLFIKAKTSQTGALIETDGIDSAGTTIEASKFRLMPKGYLVVRESGNTSTDRPPTAGSGGPTAFPTAANKPGTAIGLAGVTWFPMLDTSGALFWVPGWSA